ncbi:hypothetical protein T484DRAFT_1881582, partial [Baffinella frigidus]
MASNAWLVCAVAVALCWQGTGTTPSLRLPLTLRLRGGVAPKHQHAGEREGDWKCLSCNDFNFRWRKECHRCNAVRGDAKGVSKGDIAKGAASPARPGKRKSNEPLWDESTTQLSDHEKGRLIALREATFGPDGKRDPRSGERSVKKQGKRTRSPAQETPTSPTGGAARARRQRRANPNSEKNDLKELCAALGLPVPEYTTTISGPENAPNFQSRVEAGGLVRTVSGRNKRSAEDGASLLILSALRATSPAASAPPAPRPAAATPGPFSASPPSIALRGAAPPAAQQPEAGGVAPPLEAAHATSPRAAPPRGLVWGAGPAAPSGGAGEVLGGAVPEVGEGAVGVDATGGG